MIEKPSKKYENVGPHQNLDLTLASNSITLRKQGHLYEPHSQYLPNEIARQRSARAYFLKI